MALTAREVAEKLGPREFMRLCSKVATDSHQKFDVVTITKEGTAVRVIVELANGNRKTVLL